MLLRDVPAAPAYLVFHDAYDNGAMEVKPMDSLAEAEARAEKANKHLEEQGFDECGIWKAYTKLPRKKIYKYYPKTA